MPRFSDHLVKSAIRLLRQSTTVPNTSNTSAFTAEISDMSAPCLLFSAHSQPRHSGMRQLAQARNPYSRSWLWIPGSLASLQPPNDGYAEDDDRFNFQTAKNIPRREAPEVLH